MEKKKMNKIKDMSEPYIYLGEDHSTQRKKQLQKRL